MIKPHCNNKLWQREWELFNNAIMMKKLRHVKPIANSNCPESFIFNKTKYQGCAKKSDFKRYDISNNNMVLLKRLIDINLNNKINFTFNSNYYLTKKITNVNNKRKQNLVKIAQENQGLCKRIIEKKGYYNVKKWEKQYQQNQYYKSMFCSYPSIDFSKSITVLNRSCDEFSPGKTCKQSRINSCKSKGNCGVSYNNTLMMNNTINRCVGFNRTKSASSINQSYQQCVHSRTNDSKCTNANYGMNNGNCVWEDIQTKILDIGQLGSCSVEIVIKRQKAMWKIEPESHTNMYYVWFDDTFILEDYYKSKQQMWLSWYYDETKDLVELTNCVGDNEEFLSKCRCIKVPMLKDSNDNKVTCKQKGVDSNAI